jgi:tetratricopeptide (TPR) repeat protein
MAVLSNRFALLLVLGLLCVNSTSHAQQAPGGSAGGAAELDAGAAMDRARIYYESAKYGACVEAFRRLLDRPDALNAKERPTARTYLAACLIASGKVEEARQQFRQAILEDRQLEPPDPVVFPQAVIDVFLQVRSTLMDALRRQQEEDLRRSQLEAAAQLERAQRERQRVAELQRLAALETVIRKNERWMAWLPFGLGQFHNDDETLGWLFLGTEMALAVTAITATSIELGLHSQAQGGRAPLDNVDLTNKVRVAHQVGTVAWVSLIGVAAVGIIEANISYRSELPLGQRRRVLPDSLRAPETTGFAPRDITPLIGSGWVGVRGSF